VGRRPGQDFQCRYWHHMEAELQGFQCRCWRRMEPLGVALQDLQCRCLDHMEPEVAAGWPLTARGAARARLVLQADEEAMVRLALRVVRQAKMELEHLVRAVLQEHREAEIRRMVLVVLAPLELARVNLGEMPHMVMPGLLVEPLLNLVRVVGQEHQEAVFRHMVLVAMVLPAVPVLNLEQMALEGYPARQREGVEPLSQERFRPLEPTERMEKMVWVQTPSAPRAQWVALGRAIRVTPAYFLAFLVQMVAVAPQGVWVPFPEWRVQEVACLVPGVHLAAEWHLGVNVGVSLAAEERLALEERRVVLVVPWAV